MSDYDDIMKPLMAGDLEALKEAAEMVDDFPSGKDHFINRHWITNAIDCGTKDIVNWMISEDAPVNFEDDEGFTCLHSAIGRDNPDRIEIIRILIDAGADVNARGTNDYTPAHYAAVRDDIDALRLLVERGADLSIRTRIDEYATVSEEAQIMGASSEIIAYLKQKEAEQVGDGDAEEAV